MYPSRKEHPYLALSCYHRDNTDLTDTTEQTGNAEIGKSGLHPLHKSLGFLMQSSAWLRCLPSNWLEAEADTDKRFHKIQWAFSWFSGCCGCSSHRQGWACCSYAALTHLDGDSHQETQPGMPSPQTAGPYWALHQRHSASNTEEFTNWYLSHVYKITSL